MGIVTNGLIAYWNAQQGISGTTWSNIAPANESKFPLTLANTTVESDRVLFKGLTSSRAVTSENVAGVTSHTVEMFISADALYEFASGVPFYAITTMSNRGGFILNTTKDVNRLEYSDTSTASTFAITPNNSIVKGSIIQIFAIVDALDISVSLGVNGTILTRTTTTYSNLPKLVGLITLGVRKYNTSYFDPFKGYIYSTKIYNRVLTPQEITQNYNNGIAIGLANKPIANIISVNKSKISKMSGMDKSIITFNFDKDVQAYKVMVGGVDYNTGLLADSGGAKTANTNIVAEIDHTELSIEGLNRVTIYGQGMDGTWSTQN
uniref:ConcanavalinA-like lectin/glucanase n=1 Tax=Bacillus phage KoopaTroopa TaxID=3234046 RepID=A0AB39C702_9CAUD